MVFEVKSGFSSFDGIDEAGTSRILVINLTASQQLLNELQEIMEASEFFK